MLGIGRLRETLDARMPMIAIIGDVGIGDGLAILLLVAAVELARWSSAVFW
jgi:hypothetical protein